MNVIKEERIQLRMKREVIEEFENNAQSISQTKSSLITALMDAFNRHMAEHGKIIFPIKFTNE
jgi:hypothetical protein